MKRWLPIALLVLLGMEIAAPSFAARRVVVRRRPVARPVAQRTVVVVHRGWPIRRALPTVVVHPVRVTYRVAPVVFLAPVYWGGRVVTVGPRPDVLVWEDAETLNRDEDWTEFTLNADARGTRLWLQVTEGRVQFDWAEVTFDNGDTRVVDMKEWTRGPGFYELLDFRDGRKVDHVRVVARAKSDEARVALKMEK